MTSYLYVLSIGPVQDFIAAARRTRDLWFGSYLLSDISRAAAAKIADLGGLLIFPALARGDSRLQSPELETELEAFNVANIVLAELPEGADPQTVSTKAQNAAYRKWLEYAEGAKEEAGSLLRDDIWNAQINDIIEFNTAWVPLGSDYAASRKRLMRLFAGRKSIRNFCQAKEAQGIPKSSLDGARETVLKNNRRPYGELALKMRLSENEQLCAVGLTKRLAGGRRIAFPSVTRVALEPWIRRIRRDGGDADRYLTEIGELCAGENAFASGTGTKFYQEFPYDGQVCFPSHLTSTKRSLQQALTALPEDNPYRKDLDKLNEINKRLRTLLHIAGEPNPYFAVLVADGDHIGEAISKINSAGEHRDFSSNLSTFAGEARNIVEKSHHGYMVYSGGVDVLAFLPVDTCLKAARVLHDRFEEKVPESRVTLSIGIAIGHTRNPLGDLLDYGRAAERAAKEPNRNGLAVHLHIRGGGSPLKVREQWKPKGQNGMDERLATWIDLHTQNALPDKAAYDLLQMAGDYGEWKNPVPPGLLKKDLFRLLRQKKAGNGTRDVAEEDIESVLQGVESSDDLLRRATELVIARRIAVAMTGGDNS